MAHTLSIDHTSSIVVIAAHPDDVKNCTGVLLRGLDLGADVALIQITNGGNLGGSHTKEQSRAMGSKRKEELLAFLNQIGVERDRIFLMGIPNTMAYLLDALRTDFYRAEGLPFWEPTLEIDQVTHDDAYRPGMPFFGEALVSALAELLGQLRPTHVFTHHPRDDHRDHRATASFAREAVGALDRRPDLLAMLGYYKRLTWPPPGDSFFTSEVADHPFGLGLVQFELTPEEHQRKKQACQLFVPTLRQEYIDSYMKRDEVFWRLK